MKIGDEVYIHGYVDEIRKDTIIIKNDGGYFGTIPSEIIDKEQEPCEDFIDRADAMTEIMMFAGNNKHGDDIYIKVSDVIELLRELPSVNPQEPKTGHWVKDTITDLYHCSCCRYICRQDPKDKDNYCPNCGAKMFEKDVSI